MWVPVPGHLVDLEKIRGVISGQQPGGKWAQKNSLFRSEQTAFAPTTDMLLASRSQHGGHKGMAPVSNF